MTLILADACLAYEGAHAPGRQLLDLRIHGGLEAPVIASLGGVAAAQFVQLYLAGQRAQAGAFEHTVHFSACDSPESSGRGPPSPRVVHYGLYRAK